VLTPPPPLPPRSRRRHHAFANALPRRCHRCRRAADATVALPAAAALLPRCRRRRRAVAPATASAAAAGVGAIYGMYAVMRPLKIFFVFWPNQKLEIGKQPVWHLSDVLAWSGGP
jgi:hypothetical protein